MPAVPTNERTATPSALASLLERAAHRPAATALHDTSRTVSYGELVALAGGSASALDKLGVAPGARVAVCGPKSPKTIALVTACLLTNRPALLPAPDLRPDMLSRLLADAEVEHVLAVEPLDGARRVAVAAGDPLTTSAPMDGRAPALILTTSGSTGTPKLVPIDSGAITRFIGWALARFGIAPGTGVLSYCGLHFDLSLLEIWATLAGGGRVVLVAHERAAHGEHLRDLIAGHDVSVIQGVPTLYALLSDAADRRGALPGVRDAIVTGDVTPLRLLRRIRRALPRARLHNVYGCTETNNSFAHEIDVDEAHACNAIPLGDPLPGVEAIVMSKDRTPAEPGDGELWVHTPFQTSGYLGPHAASAAFSGNPARRYFRTGDLVRRDAAGRLFLCGRIDQCVKVRGNRVNLQDVEYVLREHPDVSEAVIVVLADERAGARLHATVRPCAGATPTVLELRSYCARRLARAAIPAAIHVQNQPLPRTITGKIDRGAVKRNVKEAFNGQRPGGQAVHRRGARA